MDQILRFLREHAVVAPGLAAVVVLVVWAEDHAGFSPTTWYPGALFVLALTGAAVAGLRLGPRSLPPAARVAVAALLAFTLWSYASIGWADARATAWDGANRTLLYLLLFALFAALPSRGRGAALVLGTWVLALVALATWTLLELPGTPNGRPAVLGPGLAWPAGYSNANAALWLMAAWPALVLASRREIPPVLRGALAGGAVILFETALLSESRGSLVASGIVLILLFAAVPGRVRTLITFAPIAVGAGLVTPRVLDVAGDLEGGPEALSRLATVDRPIFGAALLVGVAVGSGALAETLRPLSAQATRTGRRVVGTAGVAIAVGLALGGLIAVGNPADRVDRAWNSFKQGTVAASDPGDSRLTAGFGGARYDYYRVALDLFEEHPIRGIGADNFAQDYLERGRAIESPAYPHSVQLRALVQTGLVGSLLLAIAFAAAALGAVRAGRARTGLGIGVAGGGALAGAHWFAQGSADWLWEFPALGGAAFALLGLACGLEPRGAQRDPPGRRWAFAGRGLAAVLAVAAAASLTLPWLSSIELRRANRSWQVSPAAAYRQLDLAAELNPLSAFPALTEGSIALRVGDTDRAVSAFQRALEREPRNAYAVLELGAIASERGQRERARRLIARALALNPQDGITRAAHDTVVSGARIDVAALNRQLVLLARDLLR